MVVIVVIPITVGMPSAIVFTPPAMAMLPAPFAGNLQLGALLLSLRAIPAMLFSGSVQLVIDADDAPLTVFFISARLACAKQQQRTGQRGADKQSFFEQRELHSMLHFRLILQFKR
jgi:hypothetical protein